MATEFGTSTSIGVRLWTMDLIVYGLLDHIWAIIMNKVFFENHVRKDLKDNIII